MSPIPLTTPASFLHMTATYAKSTFDIEDNVEISKCSAYRTLLRNVYHNNLNFFSLIAFQITCIFKVKNG